MHEYKICTTHYYSWIHWHCWHHHLLINNSVDHQLFLWHFHSKKCLYYRKNYKRFMGLIMGICMWFAKLHFSSDPWSRKVNNLLIVPQYPQIFLISSVLNSLHVSTKSLNIYHIMHCLICDWLFHFRPWGLQLK